MIDRIANRDDRRSILLAEYLKGKAPHGEDRVLTREAVELLLQACVTERGDAATIAAPRFQFDGALIARFVAETGRFREGAP